MEKIKLTGKELIDISEEQVIVYVDGKCIILTEDFFEAVNLAALEKQKKLIDDFSKDVSKAKDIGVITPKYNSPSSEELQGFDFKK